MAEVAILNVFTIGFSASLFPKLNKKVSACFLFWHLSRRKALCSLKRKRFRSRPVRLGVLKKNVMWKKKKVNEGAFGPNRIVVSTKAILVVLFFQLVS